jgi:hypothetical protein
MSDLSANLAFPYLAPSPAQKHVMNLSRFRAAPNVRLSHLAFESDWALPTQC